MKLQFHPLARVELRAATAYYKAINPELAVSFKNEALDVRKLIEEHPLAWHPIEPPSAMSISQVPLRLYL